MHRLNAFFVAALMVVGSQVRAVSQTFETIYTSPDPGGKSLAGLVKLPDGSFLGTALRSGEAQYGTVFKVTTGGVATAVINFTGSNGLGPDGTLTLGSDGNYYGTTDGGGPGNRGVAFRVSSSGQFEKLANFSSILSASDSLTYPSGRMVQGSDGNFYGYCTVSPQSSSAAGLIYKLTASSNTLSVLARFNPDGSQGRSPADGLVRLDDNTFLGVTTAGGANNKGTIFKVTTSGTITKVVDFDGANGSAPVGALVKGSDGNFYGTTQTGGADINSAGTVFKLTPSLTFSTVASFNFANGHSPQGALVESNGTFYGLTRFGGTPNQGVAFKITPADASPAITKLAEFGTSVGIYPSAGLVFGNDGNLYGTTAEGGAANAGSVVSLTTGGTLTKVVDLGAPGGQGFAGGLVASASGTLFGAALEGGAVADGTLFSLTPAGVFTKLAEFDRNTIGAAPFTNLTVGSDQKIYGATRIGQHLFRASAGGMVEDLADFVAAGFTNPNGVIEASDGSFYGTSFGDGTDGDRGSVYRYSSAHGLEPLFQFNAATGKQPVGRLVEGPDGALYGTTTLGGAFNKGTVFRITKGGVFRTLASFSGSNGEQPTGSLVLGRDGNFYGLTTYGGLYGAGAVFRVSPTGKLNRFATFNGFNGAYPSGGLVLGPGGNLYGTAYAGGGTGKFGTVFKVTPSGSIVVLAAFDGQTNGAYPASTLCLAPDGYLYGTSYGTVFRLLTVNHPPVASNDSFTLPTIQKNVISNDTDADKDALTIVSVTDGAHGTVDFTADGTVTYTPGPDFDSPSVTTDSFTYTITDGLGGMSTATVTVTVPDDLFRAGAGVYGGVLALNGSAQGYWALGLTGVGAFTGAIYVDGVKTPIKGLFGLDGSFSTSVTRKSPLPPLMVNLQLNTIDNTITGTVASGATTYTVELIRNLPLFTSTRPTPRAGRYTVLLTPNSTGALIPAGTGVAKMTVTTKGAVAIVGKLGDGAPFAGGSFLTSDEEVPFYAQAYLKKKGYVAGLLAFADQATSEVSGVLSWKKPAQATDALYPLGFDTTATFAGARYTSGNPVLPLNLSSPSNASLVLGSVATKSLSITAANVVRVVAPTGDTTKVKIDAKTGLFSGTYPDGGTRRAFGGVIYQAGTPHGEGTFFLETTTDKVLLNPVP